MLALCQMEFQDFFSDLLEFKFKLTIKSVKLKDFGLDEILHVDDTNIGRFAILVCAQRGRLSLPFSLAVIPIPVAQED